MRKRQRRALRGQDYFLLTDEIPFMIQEAYRALRTNVIYSLPGAACKCIGVTSPDSGEGKSTTAINLAISLAQIDKKVLLLDCDMRRSVIASRTREKSIPGLSDLLVGQCKLGDALRMNSKLGIHVIPAGSLPPDATGLLESRQMEELFTALREHYDYVIVDLPPISTVPDAAIMSKYVDGYLLIVRERQTVHRRVQQMLRQLQVVNANILGFVTTGVQGDNASYYKN